MRHRWEDPVCQGVEAGSGRPYGVDTQWVCQRCGATKNHGPANTSTGQRVLRWTYRDGDGRLCDRLPECR